MTQSTTDLSSWATWTEIHAQPAIWTEWADRLPVDELRAWIAAQAPEEIWLCGAGTSAYIGDIIAAECEDLPGPRIRSVPTTDIVSRPTRFLPGRRIMVVNFGRSGNSTETVGTLDALDVLAPQAPRMNITCNAEGALATRPSAGPQRVVLLPEATHDAGFAMTSSFSTMVLTALAVLDSRVPSDEVAARLAALASRLDNLLPSYAALARAEAPTARIVFLGAGPLAFAAREAALKVMELTAGAIPALWDSSLGFRHGPKSFVTEGTRIVLFGSPEATAALYDADLAEELRAQFPKAPLTVIGPGGDIDLPMPEGAAWCAPVAVAMAQVLGVVWSQAMNLNVDDPFTGRGTLSRVVSGVRLHPVVA